MQIITISIVILAVVLLFLVITDWYFGALIRQNYLMRKKIERMEEVLTAKQKQLMFERSKTKGCVLLTKEQYKFIVNNTN